MREAATSGIVVGIDLGTTFSVISMVGPNGQPVTIPNREGQLTTPSAVLIDEDGTIVVGHEARRVALSSPERVAEYVKRQMGEELYDRPVAGRRYRPEELSAMILKKLKQDAEQRIGPIAGAVITVPAHFNDRRRLATLHAGEIAGLPVIDLINEPTAAALAYAFRDHVQVGKPPANFLESADASHSASTVVVYDLGGGTFDVTLMRVDRRETTVLGTAGESKLGGRDWDEQIVRFAAEQFQQQYGDDPRVLPDGAPDLEALQGLFAAAEEAKHALSLRARTTLLCGARGRTLRLELTRARFEDLTRTPLSRTQIALENLLEETGHSWERIDRVLLVGGSTRMPQVSEMLRSLTGRLPDNSLPADEAVAHGAAIRAALLHTRRAKELRYGAAPMTDLVVPSSPAALPAASAPAADEPGDRIVLDPGEGDVLGVVGSAFQPLDLGADPGQSYGRQAAEALTEWGYKDVLSRGLGVRCFDGYVKDGKFVLEKEKIKILLPRNTSIPANCSYKFTRPDLTSSVQKVKIYEGDSDVPSACRQLGECRIEKLPVGPKAGVEVHVTFTFEANGVFTAVAVSSGQRAELQLMRKEGMTRRQVREAGDELQSRRVE